MSEQDNNNNALMEQIAELRGSIEKSNRQFNDLLERYYTLQRWVFVIGDIGRTEHVMPDATSAILKMAVESIDPPDGITTLHQLYKFYFAYGQNAFIKRLKKTAKRWGYVYLINAPIVGLYKIGFSEKPEHRAKGLSQSLPKQMHSDVVHSIMTDNMPRLEKWFHDTLAEFRRDGEWFKLNDIQVEEITSIESVFFQTERHTDILSSREKTLRTAECYWMPTIKGSGKQKKLWE